MQTLHTQTTPLPSSSIFLWSQLHQRMDPQRYGLAPTMGLALMHKKVRTVREPAVASEKNSYANVKRSHRLCSPSLRKAASSCAISDSGTLVCLILRNSLR